MTELQAELTIEIEKIIEPIVNETIDAGIDIADLIYATLSAVESKALRRKRENEYNKIMRQGKDTNE